MKVEVAHEYILTVSNKGYEDTIAATEALLSTLRPDSAHYEYIKLHLDLYERTLQIQEEHPDIDPTSFDGSKQLGQIEKEDPTLQEIDAQITKLRKAYPYECSTWGFPAPSVSQGKCYQVS